MKFWILIAALAGSLAHGAGAVNSDLREPIFSAARDALVSANEVQAYVLAPDHYGDGAEAYQRAERIFKDGGKLERIQSLLEKAQAQFERARTLAQSNRTQLEAAYGAREDAEQAGADERAPDLWREGEVALFEAATRLEAERERGVERYKTQAESKFREAELAAIEVSLLAEVEREIAVAKDLDADDYAKTSYAKAIEYLNSARQALAEDRYDTDRPRGLASEALHEAKHAQYVSKLWESIRARDLSFEDVLGISERELANLATLLDLAVYFDDGPGAASQKIGDAITELQLTKGQLQNQLNETRRHSTLLQEEVDRLQAELGGQSRAKERLQAELARQQRLKDRVRKVEALFRAEEAQVVRIEDRLVLRLLALNFSSGQAEIEASHEDVLGKLIEALSAFPETPIIVEGHTDSYGADLTNLNLSNRRAEAVAQYLLNNSPLSPALVTSVGYGESKPIANNETAEGRRQNRRIDVVLYPNW